MTVPVELVRGECIIILDRMFHGQSLTFFGDDGAGQYGRSTFPMTYCVRSVDVELVEMSDVLSDIEAYVTLHLDGYHADLYGHATTDQNLRIDLNKLLDDWNTERDTFTWADIDRQGKTSICLKLDVQKLLAW